MVDHVVEGSGGGRSWGVVFRRRRHSGHLGGFGLMESGLDGYNDWEGIDGDDGWRGLEWLMGEGMLV